MRTERQLGVLMIHAVRLLQKAKVINDLNTTSTQGTLGIKMHSLKCVTSTLIS